MALASALATPYSVYVYTRIVLICDVRVHGSTPVHAAARLATAQYRLVAYAHTFAEKTYGMTVPGFDALVTDRIHQPPEEKKKAQAVAPRAARRALLAAAASTGVTANGSGSGSGQPAGEAGNKGV